MFKGLSAVGQKHAPLRVDYVIVGPLRGFWQSAKSRCPHEIDFNKNGCVMMSELLSAPRADALAYACRSANNSLPRLEAHTVDTIKLASLVLILDSKELRDDDVIAVANQFEDIANQGEDGPWLHLCPRESLQHLASLSPERVLRVAEAWAATEEAQLDRWTVADTTEFLKALSKFYAETVAEHRDIFLFVSL